MEFESYFVFPYLSQLKLSLKLIGKASTLGKKQKLKISRRRHIVLICVPVRTVTWGPYPIYVPF